MNSLYTVYIDTTTAPQQRRGRRGGRVRTTPWGVFIKYISSAETVDLQNCGANLQEAGYQFKRISWVPVLYAKGEKYGYKFLYFKANIKNQSL